jgi:hypothetical protein
MRDGLAYIQDHGQHQLGNDRFEVAADATAEAISALRARGLEVRVIKTGKERKQEAMGMKPDLAPSLLRP